MSKYLLIQVATESDFLFDWPEVAIVKLTEQFVEDLQARREVVIQHDLLSAEYGKSYVWPRYLKLTDVPDSEPWDRLATEGYLIIDTDEPFETSEDLIIELETLSVSTESFCFKGSVSEQAFETWDVPFQFLEAQLHGGNK